MIEPRFLLAESVYEELQRNKVRKLLRHVFNV